MKIVESVLEVFGFICLFSSIVCQIRYFMNGKKKYFKFNVVDVHSRKIEFAVRAKDRETACTIIRETLLTKDTDKWFEVPLE